MNKAEISKILNFIAEAQFPMDNISSNVRIKQDILIFDILIPSLFFLFISNLILSAQYACCLLFLLIQVKISLAQNYV